jgi:hypothetical protein
MKASFWLFGQPDSGREHREALHMLQAKPRDPGRVPLKSTVAKEKPVLPASGFIKFSQAAREPTCQFLV